MSTIVLNRIELSNLRTFNHVVFEPESAGITAIVGENGAGKTSLISAVSWALYGTKPDGVSKMSALYRSDAVWGKDKCFAIIDLSVDNSDYRVERKIVTKAGGVECNVYKWSESDSDWSYLAGPSVSHSNKEIQRLLGMDEKGFLTSIFVQQKQVDQLITAKASERTAILEKLTGITAINEAVSLAKKNSSELSSMLKTTLPNPDEVEDAKKTVQQLQSDLDRQIKNLNALSSKKEKADKDTTFLEEEYAAAYSVFMQSSDLRLQKSLLESKVSDLRDSLENAVMLTRQKKEALPANALGADFASVEKSYLDLEARLNRTRVALSREKEVLANLESVKERFSEKELSERSSSLVKVEVSISEINGYIERYSGERSALLSEYRQVKSARDVIAGNNGCCPTCLQQVSDVNKAVESLEVTLRQISDRGSAVRLRLENAQNKLSTATQEAQSLRERISALTSDKNALESLPECQHRVEQLGSEELELLTKFKSVRLEFDKVKNIQILVSQYNEAKEMKQSISSSLDRSLGELSDIEGQISELGKVPTEKKLDSLSKKLDMARESRNELAVSVATEQGNVDLSRERLDAARSKVELYEKSLEECSKVSDALEVAESSHQALLEFKKDRVEAIIPQLEAYASELLSRFTDGKFSSVNVSTKFEVTVTLSNGIERPVGMLSGGEMSATAIALRIAISQALSNGAPSLMVLDEVFVSQDSERISLILNTIKEVLKGQVILIGHNDVIESISDHNVNVNDLKV